MAKDPPKKKAKKAKKPNRASNPNEITLNDWHVACTRFHQLKEANKNYSYNSFLTSSESSNKFDASKKSAFCKKYNLFVKGELKPSNLTRQRKTKHPQIEEQLIRYIDARAQNYKKDKVGISFTLLKQKCNQWANHAGVEGWQASNGWISDALERAGRVSIKLHGEANEMTDEEIQLIMTPWKEDFHELLREKGIKAECLYNADQTGLYYQKLPNTLYIDIEEKKEVSIYLINFDDMLLAVFEYSLILNLMCCM